MARTTFPECTDAGAPAASAVYAVLGETLAAVRRLEPAVVADVDPESLHDHRVGLRRARALVRAADGVLADASRATLRDELKQLAHLSNRLRDLDVQLADERALRDLVPDVLADGLDAVFATARRERAREQENVATVLASDEHAGRWRAIEAVIAAAEPGAAGERSVTEWLAARVPAAYDHLRRAAERVGPDADDAAIHAVRIRGKRLRYLLDAFGAAVDPEGTAALVAALKKVQKRLGRANDRAMQQVHLAELATARGAGAAANQRALGGLIGALYQRQLRGRDKVLQALERFRSPARRELAAGFARG